MILFRGAEPRETKSLKSVSGLSSYCIAKYISDYPAQSSRQIIPHLIDPYPHNVVTQLEHALIANLSASADLAGPGVLIVLCVDLDDEPATAETTGAPEDLIQAILGARSRSRQA